MLVEAGQPLTVEQLQELAPHLAQSSLYRNLAVLEEAGVVCRFTSHSGFARYELTETLTSHHHHLVCSSCGAMTDVQLPHRSKTNSTSAVINLAKQRQFEPSSHTIDILGRCHDCTESSRA